MLVAAPAPLGRLADGASCCVATEHQQINTNAILEQEDTAGSVHRYICPSPVGFLREYYM